MDDFTVCITRNKKDFTFKPYSDLCMWRLFREHKAQGRNTPWMSILSHSTSILTLPSDIFVGSWKEFNKQNRWDNKINSIQCKCVNVLCCPQQAGDGSGSLPDVTPNCLRADVRIQANQSPTCTQYNSSTNVTYGFLYPPSMYCVYAHNLVLVFSLHTHLGVPSA